MKLSVVMLVRNLSPEIEAMTERNVATLLTNTTDDFDLTVVLNGGDTVCFPVDSRMKVARLGSHQSIAKAYNSAIRATRGELVCCIHNDVEVPIGWDGPMRKDAQAGFAFPHLEEPDECYSRGVDKTPSTAPPGCCFMFSRGIYDDLGGFDEQFEDVHFEDTDLWLRAIQAGYKMTRCPVEVRHQRSVTRTQRTDFCNPAFKANKAKYRTKHFDGERVLYPALLHAT